MHRPCPSGIAAPSEMMGDVGVEAFDRLGVGCARDAGVTQDYYQTKLSGGVLFIRRKKRPSCGGVSTVGLPMLLEEVGVLGDSGPPLTDAAPAFQV